MNSGSVRAGTLGLTASMNWLVAMLATGTRSFKVSKLSLAYTWGLMTMPLSAPESSV
jgi:hypothetical protein